MINAQAREACDESAADRITYLHEDNRDRARLLEHRRSYRCGVGEDQVGLQIDEFLRKFAHQIRIRHWPAMLDPDVTALCPAELQKPLAQRRSPPRGFRIVLGIRHQHADARHPLWLLRARCERPRKRRAAEQSDEVAAVHSITSSARTSNDGGTSIPSDFAVLRLMISSNLVA
jgi:hypothetical protein